MARCRQMAWLLYHARVNASSLLFADEQELKVWGFNEVFYCSCQGADYKMQIRQLEPGTIQQMKQPCSECRATGETINW
ncbi:hypothetical protein QYE76_052948 [Lolium multiflorum]|uniref:Uncharacterized protein n=1 Tax=Lolium multiflorum TaxID=4521 RepID=A0AAD8SVI9_LOLMU|nr:hypothetical protein QYE76_052948 [Lolium multiflorum]